MSDETIIAAFVEARRTQQALSQLPEPVPPDFNRAFRLQCAITRHLGWTQIGWKIGCTSERAQKALNSPGPFPGPLFAERRFASGDQVPTIASNRRVVEPEVAFTMAKDLPPRGTPYTVGEVLAAVASIHPVIEIVNPRTPNGFADPVAWFIVDGAVDDSIVVGPAHRPLEPDALTALKAGIRWNGREMVGGVGANALGGGHLALTWLANYLNGKDMGLKEGDLISTGVITEFFEAGLGDVAEAEFEGLGKVSVRF